MKRTLRFALLAASVFYAAGAASATAQTPAGNASGAFGLAGQDSGKPINIEAEKPIELQV